METSEGDAEAFQGLRAALDALARKQGIRLYRRTLTVGPAPAYAPTPAKRLEDRASLMSAPSVCALASCTALQCTHRVACGQLHSQQCTRVRSIRACDRWGVMQEVPDATLVLKGKLASVGGLKAFRAKPGHSPGFPLHALELAMSKVLSALHMSHAQCAIAQESISLILSVKHMSSGIWGGNTALLRAQRLLPAAIEPVRIWHAEARHGLGRGALV